jgi:hypothetical protein
MRGNSFKHKPDFSVQQKVINPRPCNSKSLVRLYNQLKFNLKLQI